MGKRQLGSMWRAVVGKETGSSHLRVNLPCQDRALFEITPDNVLLAALADGAGSASEAARGAEIAVSSLLTHLRAHVDARVTDFRELLFAAASEAKKAIEEAANEGQ